MDTTIKQYTTLAYALRRAGIGVTFLALAVTANANINLVTNGGFETTVCTGAVSPCTNGGGGQLPSVNSGNTPGVVTATGWANSGYAFIFTPGTGDTTGSFSSEYNLPVILWSTTNGGADVLPATSPSGGNYLGSDPVYQQGPLSQQINGLTPGHTYTLDFNYAGAQQTDQQGPTMEGWQVSFGSQTQSTPTLNNVTQGFTGWKSETFNFTADGTSDLLTFMAFGSPTGLPPFTLLDGVTLTPEPGFYVPGLGLLTVMVGLGIRRSKKSVKI